MILFQISNPSSKTMSGLLFFFALCCMVSSSAGKYSPAEAVKYVHKWWNSANHSCSSSYDACTPWSYWGMESCGYSSHGGDCANFVSQSLIAGGHPYLNQGYPCRGYPCGKEEVGAIELGQCLHQVHGWKSTCGYKHAPPSNVKVGDVLIHYSSGCEDGDGHATIVTKVVGGVKISCHSPDSLNVPWDTFVDEKPYLNWLQI
eukprot:TRINITY_DN17280_c0_g1_i1.p1 TRINITY_DN17280_c0_g1~~TRINITY_DN17280_c0_g1_i1.p1  ORF type:complete len:202 (-),score=31.87 TRINITY_DN17280_c0_g1_i1:56-661(-)